jgi:ABC-type transport system involved in multi-copper enzyme maturation permease subunit
VIRVLAAEWLKLVTTRIWWVLALVLFGYVAFTAGLLALMFGVLGDQLAQDPSAPQIPPGAIPAIVYSSVTAVGYVIPLILGTLAVTGEVRHRTLTPTFLATPRRGRALLGKLAVMLVAGAGYGVVGLIASIGLGGPIIAATGADAQLGDPATWALAARAVLAMALWAAVGVGVGSLIQNQIAAVVVVLAFTQFVEPLLRFGAAFWEPAAQVGRFLPGSASDALVGASIFSSFSGGGMTVAPLDWWQGGLVLAALAAVVAIAGYATAWRRDVT